MKRSVVIILTGPPGAGKTAIAKLIAKKLRFLHVSGDAIKETLFPSINQITDFPEELKKVKEEILKQTEKYFKEGRSVVVDYVILGEEQINRYKKFFANNLIIKVLFPPKEIVFERNKSRECWTSDKKSIEEVYEKFIKLRGVIGSENYIDTADETPEQTFLKHFSNSIS